MSDDGVRSIVGSTLAAVPWCCIAPAAFAVSGVATAGIGTGLRLSMPALFALSAGLLGRSLYLALVKAVGSTRVLLGSVGFVVDKFNVLGPDLVVFDQDEIPDHDAKDVDRAALVVEVLSPSTASRDRSVKTQLYLDAGVSEVWLVDAVKRTVEVRSATGVHLAQGDEEIASDAIGEFAVRLAELFA